ncbi:hypothetical protein Tco_0661452 [Tanacetum coccineum]
MKEVIVEDYVSSGEDVEQGIGEEESAPSDEQFFYDVKRQAIHSYTEFFKELDKGNIENVKAPAIAVDYWRLPADATLLDVVMVVREDEAHHRDVNHFASDIHYEGPLHNQPEEHNNNVELRNVLGDTIGNPDQMRLKLMIGFARRGGDFHMPKLGSVVAFKVTFRESTAKKTTTTRVVVVSKSTSGDDGDDDVSSSGSRGSGTTARGRRLLKVREEKRKREFDRLNNYPSWAKYLFIIHFISFHFYYSVVLANTSMEYNPLYDADKGFNVMPSSFHDIGDVEFQDNWGRVWVDIGTSDYFALDVLLNCLTVLSSEYCGIQQFIVRLPGSGHSASLNLKKKDSSMEIRNERSSSICSGGVVVNKRIGTVELKCVKGKLDLIILENASSMCTLSNRNFVKLPPIVRISNDDGGCVPHLVMAILIVYVESTPPEEHHRVVVYGPVSFSSSAKLALGATPALRRRIL